MTDATESGSDPGATRTGNEPDATESGSDPGAAGVTAERRDTGGPPPVLLHYDPHPVHRKMGEAIGAEFVQCRTGGLRDRVRGALDHDFGDRTVVLEGGVPLLEGAVAKLAGNVGRLVALGADATYHDVVDPLPFRDRRSRLAHRAALRFVDGTIAVSDRIAAVAERFGGPARVAHPFVHEDRFDALGDVEPDLAGSEVLCLGKYRPKNGQDLLVEALSRVEADVTVHFVGADTDDIPAGDGSADDLGSGDPAAGTDYVAHGFVDEDELLERFAASALLVFPALAGAFPVATLEGLRAGLPVVTTSVVGTAATVRPVSARLVADPDPASVAAAVDWYFSLDPDRRAALSARARRVGSQFDEETGLDSFVHQYETLLEQL